jgi:3-hydroxybutyrate dehydrogenase
MNIAVKPQSPTAGGSLTGKVAVVTGSTSGIGLGIARALAADGAKVVLNGFGDPGEIENIRAEFGTLFGHPAGYSAADMSKPEAIELMIHDVWSTHQRLDILVNNAGVQHVAPIDEFPAAKWDLILAINLTACFHTTRLALPCMRRNGFGRIINVASAHGLVASPYKSAYVAAKHGLIGLTRTAALETAEAGITCNAICPGYVWTPLVERQIEDQASAHKLPREQVVRDILLKAQPNKRFATVEEIGALAAFLAGPLAASITGAALPVDGGWTAH